MRAPEVRHIIWDWNGTLLDDTWLTVHAASTVLEAFGKPRDLTIEDWRQVATRPLIDTYVHLLGTEIDEEQWESLAQIWLDAYLSRQPEVGLNPMALSALEDAASMGLTQSIVSLHTESELRAEVGALGIADLFTHICGSRVSWGERRPPKSAEVRSQLQDLGVDPREALMIGDMEDDAREARDAGVRVVLVPTGDTSRERLVASGFPLADSLTDAVRLITR